MTEEQGQVLLHIARVAISAELKGKEIALPVDSWLQEKGASFVTLRQNHALRGCIGTIEAYRDLGKDVAENAVAAAFRDPRFPVMQEKEWDKTLIEVSTLSAMEGISFTDEADALAKLQPTIDGVVFSCNGRKATFLPQVWESLPTPALFLNELKRKAGFDKEFWAPQVQLSRYRVEKWAEK